MRKVRNIKQERFNGNIINNDLYIGGKWEEKNGISIEAFNYLIKIFPNSIELNKYADNFDRRTLFIRQ